MKGWLHVFPALLVVPFFLGSTRGGEPRSIRDGTPASKAGTATDRQQRTDTRKETCKAIDEARRLLASMRGARRHLRSGVVNVSGTFAYHSSADRDIRGDVRMYIAFDDTLGLLRIDRNEVRDRTEASGADQNSESPATPVKLKFVRTPKHTITWEAPWAPMNVNIDAPEAKPTADLSPLDIHAVGIANVLALQIGQTFQELVPQFAEDKPPDVRDEGNGVYLLVWDRDEPAYKIDGKIMRIDRQMLWIDETKGFAPIRYEFLDIRESETRAEFATKCSWAKIADAWVPVMMSCKDGRSSYLLTFDWKSVNAKIPESAFSLEDMKLPRFALVCDVRPEDPIVLGQIVDLVGKKRPGPKAAPAP
jgi:hypothetical protein